VAIHILAVKAQAIKHLASRAFVLDIQVFNVQNAIFRHYLCYHPAFLILLIAGSPAFLYRPPVSFFFGLFAFFPHSSLVSI
jgi:hypothetical protein